MRKIVWLLRVTSAALLLGVVPTAAAFDYSPYVSVAFTFGGDSVGKTVKTDPQAGTSTTHTRAGQLFQAMLGATFAAADVWEAQASVGYWFDSTTGNGGELKFLRIPIDLLAIRNMSDSWRVLGGPTWHTGVRRRCTQDNCTVPGTSYDDAFGIVAGVDWLVGGPVSRQYTGDQPRPTKLWFGARMTRIKYVAPKSEGGSVDGSSIGFIVGLNF